MSGVAPSRVVPRPPTKATRPAPRLIRLWRPDGSYQEVLESNASDYVRLMGYTRQPRDAVAIDTTQQPSDAGLDAIAALDNSDDDAPRSETPKLDALRQELRALGGDPLPTMGIRSLNAAIAAAKEAKTASRDAVLRKGQESLDASK